MKKIISLILACVLIFALFTGCADKPAVTPSDSPPPTENSASPSPTDTGTPPSTPAPPETASPPAQGFAFTAENFPRIDGSTATIPLGQAVMATLLGIPRGDTEDKIQFSGTNNAYHNLSNGTTDLLIVYEGTEEVMEWANEQFDIAPIGRDALVFLVNVKNPVESLTVQQLRDVYTGAVSNWNEIGGANSEIRAFQRNETSGSQVMMKKLAMQGLEMTDPETTVVISEMGGLVDAIAAYDNSSTGIGYNVYYYVSQMKLDENIKLLSIDGVAPTSENIGSGKYPFVNEFYVIVRKDAAEDSPERLLFNWLQGDYAKGLMRSERYVPIG